MAKPKEDAYLDPEAKKSIDQIVDGLRRYLLLLVKNRTTHRERQAKGERRK
jgi:hypothetical protein